MTVAIRHISSAVTPVVLVGEDTATNSDAVCYICLGKAIITRTAKGLSAVCDNGCSSKEILEALEMAGNNNAPVDRTEASLRGEETYVAEGHGQNNTRGGGDASGEISANHPTGAAARTDGGSQHRELMDSADRCMDESHKVLAVRETQNLIDGIQHPKRLDRNPVTPLEKTALEPAYSRIPPQDILMEQSVLGSILLEPACIDQVSAIITPSDFYRESHREIYKAMLGLAASGKLAESPEAPIDVATLQSELRQRDLLELTGGAAYLAELAQLVPTSLHVRHFAEKIKEVASKRDIIRGAFALMERAYNGTSLPELVQQIGAITPARYEKPDARPALMGYRESARLAAETQNRPHVIENLLTAEDISGLAAKKGVGKSTLLRWMAVAVSRGDYFLGLRTNQTRVWYLDLEPGSQAKRHEMLEKLGWDESSGDLIVTACPPVAGQPWAFEWLEENVVKYGFGLVIIDTLFKFCKIEQANDYSSGLYGSAPLEGIMKRTKAHITVAHHSQKNGNPNNPNASAADLFLGAVSIAGSFGVCLAMRRQRGGNQGSRTTLFMDPPRYTDQVIEGEWLLTKDPLTNRIDLGETLARDWWNRAQGDVMLMAEQLRRPFTVTDFLERTDDYKRKELKRVLTGLVDDGKLIDMGKEAKRGGAVRYELPKFEPGLATPKDRRLID